MGTIVVGIDGSNESRRALAWAIEEAGLRGHDLRVVHAYDYKAPMHAFAVPEGMSAEQAQHLQEDLQREADQVRQDAESFVGEAVREASPHGVKVQTVVLRDRHPARALVEQSEDAEMLVVGSRGRGGFVGLVLGSVSQHCVHHVTCPVVVIRPRG